MIPVTEPTIQIIRNVLLGIISGKYSRQDAKRWIDSIQTRYGSRYPGTRFAYQIGGNAEWILIFLAFITDKGFGFRKKNEDITYFIRETDLQEYLLDLDEEDCDERNGNITRIRQHQISSRNEFYYAYVAVDSKNGDLLEKVGVFFTSGLYDDLAEHKEVALISYLGSTLTLEFSHERNNTDLYINGFMGDKEKIAKLLLELEVTSDMLHWVNDHTDNETCELYRYDDNGNEFLVETYNSYIEAEVSRYTFEARGHKQIYYLKRGEAC